ncbi:MAG TPA: GEVED domain-containing protein [Flavobacterium sp.]|nr:GEVED domain-containing protein [Flavobacterium sp.]
MKKITLLIVFFIYLAESKAQAVSGYLFSQSTETYVPVVGTSSTAIDDDGTQNNIPIGFSFNYGGVSYTTFSISTNGWIRLGSGIPGNSWVNTLATPNGFAPLIAAFWDDHNRSGGDIEYAVAGTTPNRTLAVGWDNINIDTGGGVNDTNFGSFKMVLHETTGAIDMVYGSIIPGAQLSASIGLNDLTSFNSVTPAAIATVSGTTANNSINDTSSLEGKKYTFFPQPQCSGTPAPGNTLSTLASVCANYEFTLSLSNNITDFGISYQWQSSANGIDFTNIDNAISTSLLLTQPQATYYQCVVSCGANSAVSTPVLVGQNSISACYCLPTYTNGKTDGDLISNVVIVGTTLANNTGTAPINPSYTYFTGQPNYTATLQSGFSYIINVTVGTYGQQNDAVWIDYNDDTIFSDDEKIGYTPEEIGANGTGTFTITLACDAPAGTHRMRIRDAWATDSFTMNPCDNYGYGETEDYDITILEATECQAPYELTADNINSGTAQLHWQTGCSQISWDVLVVAAGAPAPLPDATPTQAGLATNSAIVSSLDPNTDYVFYVRSNCELNGSSDWAGPVAFATLPVAVANDDCQTAIALIPGANFAEHAIIATNVGATKTIGEPNPTCGVFGFGGDVWFSVVVPSDGNVTIEVQSDSGSPVIDTALSAFSGACGTLTTLGCSDDEGVDAFSMLNLTGLIPGTTIYARVWEYANDTFGTFQVSAWNPMLKTSGFDAAHFEYYPNPVKDFLNLSYSQKISDVSVFNLLGQQVFSKTIGQNQSKIDLSALPKGAYLVRVNSESQMKTIKIIKE